MLPREKTKICFFELTATPDASPRYRLGGSLRKFGTDSSKGFREPESLPRIVAQGDRSEASKREGIKERVKTTSWVPQSYDIKSAGIPKPNAEMVAPMIRSWKIFDPPSSPAAPFRNRQEQDEMSLPG